MNRQVPRWEEIVGPESARGAAQIFQALHREKREIKRPDATDFIHAVYLPHADLWRGDKDKALLRKAAERTIPDLWRRIRSLLRAVCPEECANFFRHAGYVST